VEKRYKYAFTYDALQRLMSADYSGWSGSAWVTEPNYDLPWIGYDRNGNVTGLQRNRQDGSRIDDLSYGIGSSSNRLYTIVENAPGSPSSEAWDAEAAASGSFTYDPNGNLKTAPDPYFFTAITYDPQNLPLSLTRSGTTTTYRYDDAGQRITKQVGGGNTEVYLREGAATLGVFTVNTAGTPVSWYFNVLAEEKVVGRQPNTGNRSYYHTDLLGSTRAVVQGVTVVESYDFDPWGVLMPGRTLGSGTKEGFTGKEQDTETGLDYFGARYYMPALARWAAVDPLSEKHPEWSPYNYVLDNPLALFDPDGRQVDASRHLTPLQAQPGCGAGGDPVACLSAALHPINQAQAAVEELVSQELEGFGCGSQGGYGCEVPEMGSAGALLGQFFLVLGMRFQSGAIDDAAVGRIGGDATQTAATAPYNRRLHYGYTPTRADRATLGAGKSEVVDHDPSLVRRYYEGDPRVGEKPGSQMTPQERRASANDRSRMRVQSRKESNQQGRREAEYSQEQKKKQCRAPGTGPC